MLFLTIAIGLTYNWQVGASQPSRSFERIFLFIYDRVRPVSAHAPGLRASFYLKGFQIFIFS